MLASEAGGEAGVVLDAVGAGHDIHRLGLLDRLAGVGDLQLGELAVARAQDRDRAVEDAAARSTRHR